MTPVAVDVSGDAAGNDHRKHRRKNSLLVPSTANFLSLSLTQISAKPDIGRPHLTKFQNTFGAAVCAIGGRCASFVVQSTWKKIIYAAVASFLAERIMKVVKSGKT
jgi:hypothetical protein